MLSLLRALHVLSVALWFGSVAFFTIAGVLLFDGLTAVSIAPGKYNLDRWLPEPPAFAARAGHPVEGLPDVARERGSRLAGAAVSAIFPVYYALQAGCAVLALVTAILLARSGEGTAHAGRVLLCVLALATVLAGWWLEHKVSVLRGPRNDLTDRALAEAQPGAEVVAEARAARAEFGQWHGYSLVQNFATLALVFVLTLLVPAVAARSP